MNYQTLDSKGAKSTNRAGVLPMDTCVHRPESMCAIPLTGNDVFNPAGEDLGNVTEIMLDTRSGRVAYAVLSFGGFLGMNQKLFAVPWNALQLDTVNKRFTLNVDKSSLESAPGFDKDKWPETADQALANSIDTYYGTKPYPVDCLD